MLSCVLPTQTFFKLQGIRAQHSYSTIARFQEYVIIEACWPKIEGAININDSIKNKFIKKTNSIIVYLGQNWYYNVYSMTVVPFCHFCWRCDTHKNVNELQKIVDQNLKKNICMFINRWPSRKKKININTIFQDYCNKFMVLRGIAKIYRRFKS